MKYVIANVVSATEAQNTVTDLMNQGYPADSISLVSDVSMQDRLTDFGVAVETSDDYKEGLWQSIKDFFSADADECQDLVNAHKDDLMAGNVLVIVDDAMVPDSLRTNVQDMETGYWQNQTGNVADNDAAAPTYNANKDLDDDTIRLTEERMNINKQEVEAGEVVINKRVVEENQTINVPVQHEEVVIERRPVTDFAAKADDNAFESESYTIPLWQEQVSVTKQPVVTEEVHVRKNEVTANKEYTETLRKEKLDVDKTGNVVLHDQDNDTTAPRA